jgi:hypothetical protein
MSEQTPPQVSSTDEAIEAAKRARYFDELAKAVNRYADKEWKYEKEAIDLAAKGFQSLTYLNGGALVAIPTAVALFHSDLTNAKHKLLCAAGLFIIGLLLVVGAMICAFFVTATRGEASNSQARQQIMLLNLVHYPEKIPDKEKTA